MGVRPEASEHDLHFCTIFDFGYLPLGLVLCRSLLAESPRVRCSSSPPMSRRGRRSTIGRLLAQRLRDHPELGLRPVGFLDKNPIEAEAIPGVPILGASWDFDRVVAEYDVKHVLIGFSTAPSDVLLRLVRQCEGRGARVSYVPRFFEKMSGRISIDHVGALPFVTAEATNPRSWQFTLSMRSTVSSPRFSCSSCCRSSLSQRRPSSSRWGVRSSFARRASDVTASSSTC